MKTCLKCGYERTPEDSGPDYACPRCDAVYAKVEAAQKIYVPMAKRTKSTKNSLRNPFVALGALFLFVLVIVHGSMLLRYGALGPCEAAARRIAIGAHEENAGGPLGGADMLVLKNLTLPIVRARVSMESTPTCYKVALGLKRL